MDRSEYQKKSREQNLPPTCPLVKRCKRWILSVYFNSYYKQDPLDKHKDIIQLLYKKHEIDLNYIEDIIELEGDSLWENKNPESVDRFHFCPEVHLYGEHKPIFLPQEAITSYMWSKEAGLTYTEHLHFSECWEFSHFQYQSEVTVDFKKELLKFRDFIERQAYKDIFVNGKPQENIARALLQAFMTSRSYREVPVRGGRSDILCFYNQKRAIYELKIWGGKTHYEQGLRELKEYIQGEDSDTQLTSIFYVIFDKTKGYISKQYCDKTKGYISRQYMGSNYFELEVEDKLISVVTIHINLPQPSRA